MLPLRITRAESQTVSFIRQGFSNKQIAGIPHPKERTVRDYVSMLLQKTKLKHRTQTALYALNNGLLPNYADKHGTFRSHGQVT
jgi:DNA-binding NarL/FixJ family response regulator